MFDDGAKGRIKGIGKQVCLGLPNFKNVLLVKGITSDLISISKLCDQGLKVSFNKSECIISSQGQEVVMKGARFKDNCYL